MNKLNVLLATTDHQAAQFRKCLEDYVKFFKSKQGEFKGEKKTYTPKDGTIDIPSERKNDIVVTTVDEKLKWLEETLTEYIDSVFSVEATNSSGNARARLVVDGTDLGEFSSLELLRLKSLLESGTFEEMYSSIPVRSDSEQWDKTTNEAYQDREIFESPIQRGTRKSVMKEAYILPDPNITKGTDSKYTPQIASKDTVIELGDYTFQKYSGEWSHRQRAELLRRRTSLLSSVIAALKTANEAEAVQSKLTAKTLFNYLHKGE